MFNGKLFRDISNHPFIFLIVLGSLAIALMGGYLLVSGKGILAASRPTATLEPTATLTPMPTTTHTPFPPTPTTTLEPTSTPGPLVVTFIDVGQGDAILITSPEGQVALIDGGNGDGKALAYLQEQGIKSIDIMIASLPLAEHIGGLAEVLDAMPVKTVIANPQSDTSDLYRHFLDAVATAKSDYIEVETGDSIHLGSLILSVLSPAVVKPGNLDTNSLVLGMTYGKTSFLFMGDADKVAEEAILAAALRVQADILKVGRHGSCRASDPAYLDAVHPTVAVYFAGLNNPYGNPCSGTIRALKERGVGIFGTDIFGSITVIVTPDGYLVENSTGLIYRK